jgi:hypothetical protein
MDDTFRLTFREKTGDGESEVDGVYHLTAADVDAVKRRAGFSARATPSDVSVDPDGGLRVIYGDGNGNAAA